MTDLAAALREAGHDEIAQALERRELAGRLRHSGRDDLADALEADPPPETPAEGAEPDVAPSAVSVNAAQRLTPAQAAAQAELASAQALATKLGEFLDS